VCGFGHGLPPRCAVAQKSLEDTDLTNGFTKNAKGRKSYANLIRNLFNIYFVGK